MRTIALDLWEAGIALGRGAGAWHDPSSSAAHSPTW